DPAVMLAAIDLPMLETPGGARRAEPKVLTREHVEPLGPPPEVAVAAAAIAATEPPVEESANATPEPAAVVSRPAPVPMPGPPPRVLIAEDSITARVFLTRLFEHAGAEVHAVASAAALM